MQPNDEPERIRLIKRIRQCDAQKRQVIPVCQRAGEQAEEMTERVKTTALKYTNFPAIPLDVVQVTLLMFYGIYLLRGWKNSAEA